MFCVIHIFCLILDGISPSDALSIPFLVVFGAFGRLE